MEEANRVLVVSTLEDASLFMRTLVGKTEQTTTSARPAEVVQEYSLMLDTKYYTAKLHLWLAHAEGFPAPHHVPDETAADAFGEACQAIVLLFDQSNVAGFNKLKGWAKFVEDYGPSVQLCVATGATSASDPRYNSCRDWCVENGFEFITMQLNDDGSSSEEANDTSSGGSLLVDKEGRGRIVEALEANMWPQMQMKSREYRARKLSEEEQQEETETKEEKEENEKEDKGDASKKLATESLINQFDEEEDEIFKGLLRGKRAEEARDKHQQPAPSEGGEKEKATEDASSATTGGAPGPSSLLDELSVEDEESFEKALSRLGEMRAKAATLPDEERRDMAARVALMFAGMLGLGDDDDGDD